MRWNGLPIVIIGTSGISKEVKTIIEEINLSNYEKQYDFLGFVSEDESEIGKEILDTKVISSDSNFEIFLSKYKKIGVVIPIGTPKIKRNIYNKLKKYENIVYPNIISPTAKIMDKNSCEFGYGNIICSGCVLTTEISIGNFNLINLNSTIGHGVKLQDYCVINPLSSISGDVQIDGEVLCGSGCQLKQGIHIGAESIIGLGAFIVKDVEPKSIMICKSAEIMKK